MQGDELKSLRERRGENQQEFAAWLNGQLGRKYDKQRISRWELGAERVPQAVAAMLHESAEALPARPKNAVVVSVANQKGGVAKTASAVNIAYLLSQTGAAVLLVDADPQSNATMHVGLAPQLLDLDRQQRTLFHVLKGVPAASAVHATDYAGLSVLPASVSLADADIELASPLMGQQVLREKFDEIRDAFDFIVVDCAPNLGMVTINALAAADFLLVPVQTEAHSLIGVQRLFHTVDLLRRRANLRLDVLGLLPTLYSAGNSQDRETLADIERSYAAKVPIFPPVPRRTVYAKAAAAGVITLAGDPSAPGHESYKAVRDAILEAAKRREARHAA